MLLCLVLSTEYKLFLSKYNTCIHNVPFFSDTSTWYHKVHSKYVGKCLLLQKYLLSFCWRYCIFYITIYHLCISRLSWDFIWWYIIHHDYRGITKPSVTVHGSIFYSRSANRLTYKYELLLMLVAHCFAFHFLLLYRNAIMDSVH